MIYFASSTFIQHSSVWMNPHLIIMIQKLLYSPLSHCPDNGDASLPSLFCLAATQMKHSMIVSLIGTRCVLVIKRWETDLILLASYCIHCGKNSSQIASDQADCQSAWISEQNITQTWKYNVIKDVLGKYILFTTWLTCHTGHVGFSTSHTE